ncbi:GNAT family N-acetyltransferase [Haloactinopolyspora alba]|uniref:GNAT family N-acetyltransferase n=1 Tax=Haloactinopolyspora alba TaxID=648780 RepID=UPI000D0D245A|nr:GNAT family N-acetyltransferase [Haloactinopolyspora alba]
MTEAPTSVTVHRADEKESFPGPDEVEAVYQAAAAEPPLREPASVAALFAHLYRTAIDSMSVTCAVAHAEDRLVGFAYGHEWRWSDQTDEWADTLRRRLGSRAALLDGSFVIALLARHPDNARAGLGARLLDALVSAVEPASCWLNTTDVRSPALTLYTSRGFEPVGHGPDAPDGRPGLVMVRR